MPDTGSQHRTRVLSVRLTEAEWTALASRARECEKALSCYVRETSLGAIPRARPGKIQQQAIHQLARIGNNLNQLTRTANTMRRVELTRRLDEVLTELVAALRRLS